MYDGLHRVFIVGPDSSMTVMFNAHPDFICVNQPDKATIHVFIGGADIEPSIYEQQAIAGTRVNPNSDARDLEHWKEYQDSGKTFVGICRGAQLLNALNGGQMWQDVEGHNRGVHELVDLISGDKIRVTSTHHQMMRAADSGEVLAIANVSRFKKDDKQEGDQLEPYDTEVVWYSDTRCLCFQPHPEYTMSPNTTREYFFSLLEKLLTEEKG